MMCGPDVTLRDLRGSVVISASVSYSQTLKSCYCCYCSEKYPNGLFVSFHHADSKQIYFKVFKYRIAAIKKQVQKHTEGLTSKSSISKGAMHGVSLLRAPSTQRSTGARISDTFHNGQRQRGPSAQTRCRETEVPSRTAVNPVRAAYRVRDVAAAPAAGGEATAGLAVIAVLPAPAVHDVSSHSARKRSLLLHPGDERG